MSPLPAIQPTPLQVLHRLIEAFPKLLAFDQGQRRVFNRSIYGPDGPVYWSTEHLTSSSTMPGDFYARQQCWWEIAGLVTEVLDQRGWTWSVGSGNSSAAYCALVDQPRRTSRTRFSKSATGWAEVRGLALCIAACEATLGREIWATASVI